MIKRKQNNAIEMDELPPSSKLGTHIESSSNGSGGSVNNNNNSNDNISADVYPSGTSHAHSDPMNMHSFVTPPSPTTTASSSLSPPPPPPPPPPDPGDGSHTVGTKSKSKPVNVQTLFDWYFDSSDEGEELMEKSQRPEDLRKMFRTALRNRCGSSGDEDNSSRSKPEGCLNSSHSSHPRHQSPSRAKRVHNNSSSSCRDVTMDGATTDDDTKIASDHRKENIPYGREFDEEEEVKGHYDDVINVFKGVCDDLDNADGHLTEMFSMHSAHSMDYAFDPVKYAVNESSFRGRLRRLFIRNSSTRLPFAFLDLALRITICLVYIVQVVLDDFKKYECNGSQCGRVDNTSVSERDELFASTDINWYVILWVRRSLFLWVIQVTLAAISMTKALIIIYAMGKGHRMQLIWSYSFLLEIICSVPILATLCYPPLLINLFVPVYFNCWLARKALQQIYNDLHLTNQKFQNISVTLWQQMILLLSNLACLVFTNVCSIQHIQRASKDTPLHLLDAFYFIIVTFSTVGYGDISPDIWLSQLFMVLVICVAIASIPRQIEGLISVWMERKKSGGEYRSDASNKHVIVCSSVLSQASVMDFLTEFYAHPKLEEHTVILLCSQELDSSKQVILKDPKWSHRVIYMMGSSLSDSDLSRCHAHEAVACFFLVPRPCANKVKADEHTILRSWAVKDFAPNCKQYIQLYSAVNKIHVKFAEHVVCEDEFKYALLANNCLYPGLSTLVSLLVHTTSGQECMLASESWQQVYGRHSGNEIYHIQLQKSAFFSQYAGDSFTAASADAHHRFGVSLLAVMDSDSPSLHLQLNPGPEYILKGADFCFYMSVTREEYSQISPEALRSTPRRQNDTLAQIALALQKYHGESEDVPEEGDESVFDTITSLMGNNISKLAKSMTKDRNRGDANVFDSNFNMTPKGANDSAVSCKNIFKNEPQTPTTIQEQGEKKTKGIGEEQDEIGEFYNANERERLLEETPEEDIKLKESNTDDEGDGEEDNVDHRHGGGRVLQFYNDMGQEKLTIGLPPVTIYAGPRRASCHIMTEPRHLCCLEWGKHCDHCAYKNARDERWQHQLIILAAEHPTSGIFNFIVPLRSSFIGINGLCPIVLLLEEEPDALFLDTMAQFPLVYWMIGSIHRVDDLLLAGINKASHLVVVNRDSATHSGRGEDILGDSETIVAVQTIFKLFPNTNVVTELSQASNMRFMQLSASDSHIHRTSRAEKQLKHTYLSSNFNHIYRLPFAAGQVFSASMLDTLLYQTFVKGYLISFVRLLLGIDAEEGSGHLSSIRVKRATIEKFPEFGQLYEGLCSATGEIPFAIYRTERLVPSPAKPAAPRTKRKTSKSKLQKTDSTISEHRFAYPSQRDQEDLGGLIRHRLQSLDLYQDFNSFRKRPNVFSYVIINPSSKIKLRIGDIVYVLQPSSMYAKPSRQKLYLQKSFSYGGPSPLQSDENPNFKEKPSMSGAERKVGRFNLRRYVSEKARPSSTMEFEEAQKSNTKAV